MLLRAGGCVVVCVSVLYICVENEHFLSLLVVEWPYRPKDVTDDRPRRDMTSSVIF